jgi:RHS repeat-associated protein
MLQNCQISHICRKKHKCSVKTDVSYDPTGRITGFSQAGTATVSTPLSNITFTYDANGNRQSSIQNTTTVAVTGTATAPILTPTTQRVVKNYQIAGTGNKLLGFSQTMTQTGGATSNASVNYSYDANGSLLTDGLRHYAYDSEGRLAAASLGWSSTATTDDSITKYAHNAAAQRVFKTASLFAVTNPEPTATPSVLAAFTAFFESLWSPTTTATEKAGMSYFYDEAGTLIADTLTGGATTSWGQSARYIYLPTASGPMPVAAIYGTKHYAIQSDHLNTPRRLVQSDGQVAWQWAYSAFGDEQPTVAKNRFANTSLNQSFGSTTVAAVTFNLRYPGQYYDQESNLHYNWHRSLDTKVGRYTQSDPIGLDGGWNRYSYVGGNALSRVDPLGLEMQLTLYRSINTMVARDLNTNTYFAVTAFSGGQSKNGIISSPGRGLEIPAPNGSYIISDNPNYRNEHPDWFGLLKVDGKIDDFADDRGGFRLHGGTVSHGCATIDTSTQSGRQEWIRLAKTLLSTSTSTVTYEEPWYTSNRTLRRYGTLRVVD